MSSEQYTEGRFLTPSECAFFFKILSGKRTCRANDLSGKWCRANVPDPFFGHIHTLIEW